MKPVKHSIALGAAGLVSTFLATAISRATVDHSSTVITNVTILDGRGSEPRPNASIVVTSGRIAAIGGAHADRPVGAQVIDGHGGYLLPGFIDMHAHLLVPRCGRQADGSIFDRGVSERMLAVLLDFGITTIRSPANPTVSGLRLRDDLNAGRVRGPFAFASAEFINDPSLAENELRQIVRDALQYRPDYFKVYARLSPPAVAAVLDEAHAHGIPVIGHLGETSWLEGARLGIDYLTHAADWSASTLPPERRAAYTEAVRIRGAMRARIDWLELLDLGAPAVRAMVDEVARRGIAIDPTLVAYDTKFSAPDGGRYRRDQYVGLVPEMLSDWTACSRITADWTADDYSRWRAAYPKMQALVRLLRDGGIPLTTGTDLTNPWVIPGESLHREFELLAEAGLSPGEILRMTGVNAARSLRRSDIGAIEIGRRADFVLIRANPLLDIRNTRHIRWTMKGGLVVSDGPHVPARVHQVH